MFILIEIVSTSEKNNSKTILFSIKSINKNIKSINNFIHEI